jgi:hypothetical protein
MRSGVRELGGEASDAGCESAGRDRDAGMQQRARREGGGGERGLGGDAGYGTAGRGRAAGMQQRARSEDGEPDAQYGAQ